MLEGQVCRMRRGRGVERRIRWVLRVLGIAMAGLWIDGTGRHIGKHNEEVLSLRLGKKSTG